MVRHYNDARTARDLDSRAKILSPVHEGARCVAAQRNRARAAPNGASPSESRARRGCYTDRWDMLLAREFIGYLSRQLVERLTPSTFETSNPPAVAETISEIIGDDLSIEDRLNDEVRDVLDEYSEYMRREGVSYQEMFRRIKNQFVAQRKIIRASGRDTGDQMKLSRDKVNELSHKIVTGLRKSRDVRVRKDSNEVRLVVVKEITDLLQMEERVDRAARAKIRSQKREITEGGEEYDLLHRRYYAEELKKLGIDLSHQ